MRTFYTTLDKAKTIAAMAGRDESAIFQVIGFGYIVGRTQLRELYKIASDLECGVNVRVAQDKRE